MRLPPHRYTGLMPWDELDLNGLPEQVRIRVQAAYLASQLSAHLDRDDPTILEVEQALEMARSITKWISDYLDLIEHTDELDLATKRLAQLAMNGEHDGMVLVSSTADGGPPGYDEEVAVPVPIGPEWVAPYAWRATCRLVILAALEENRDGQEDEDEEGGEL